MSKQSMALPRYARLLVGAVWQLAGLSLIAQPAFAQGSDRAAIAPSANINSERPGPLLDSPRGRPESGATREINAAIRLGQFHQAFALLERAANSGDVEAQYLLSSFYRSGRGVRQDDALAFKWSMSKQSMALPRYA